MILVFGKTGQVATELRRHEDVFALGREDVDLLDLQTCAEAIKHFSPKAVINSVAYTSVDKAEEEELLATIINRDAPTVMAEACAELGIPLVHISTDYVFAGTGEVPWTPIDPALPQNAYGRSKLAGEIGICQSGAVYCILRTSWVVSAHRTNFVKTMLRLTEVKDIINVVSDQIGGPTPAKDIAAACVKIAEQLIENPSKLGTYHYSGMPDVSWAEFASEIFEFAGKSVKVNPILTVDFATLAARPLNSRMDCSMTEKIFGIYRPNWREGLKVILKDLEFTQ